MSCFRKQSWIKIPGNYISSRIIKPEYAEKFIQNKRIFPRNDSTIEQLIEFYSNGGHGIDMSFTETCIFHAIAYLFTAHDYPEYVEFNKHHIYKAMRYNTGPCGWEINNLIDKLEKLSTKKYPFFWKEDNYLWLYYDNLFTLEKRPKKNDHPSIIRSKEETFLFKIKFNQYLVSQMINNFRMIPSDLGLKIREYRKTRNERPSKYDIRFFDLLIQENKKAFSWNFLKIARGPMLMGKLIKNRKIHFIRQKLLSIYKMYKELGFLNHYQINQQGTKDMKDIFFLNPVQFYKLRDPKTNE